MIAISTKSESSKSTQLCRPARSGTQRGHLSAPLFLLAATFVIVPLLTVNLAAAQADNIYFPPAYQQSPAPKNPPPPGVADSDGWINGNVDEIQLRPKKVFSDDDSDQSNWVGEPGRRPGGNSSGGAAHSARGDAATAAPGSQMHNPVSPGQNPGPSPGQSPGQTDSPMDDETPTDGKSPVIRVRRNSPTLTGGVASSTFRGSTRANRGLDGLSQQFLQEAPFLDTPRTATVQPGTFKSWLQQNHGAQTAQFGKNTIVEVKGQWDDAGHVLRNFGLPYMRVSPSKLKDTDLSGTKVMVINCGAEFSDESLAAVRKFVQKGGYLMTTDWALDSCLQRAFPGYVEWNGGYTENQVADAVVVDRDPILLAGVPKVAYWKLENKSQTVKVDRGTDVQVLARSRFLMKQEPSEQGILALTFPFGRGRVLHLVGHFDNNADLAFNNALPDPAPIIGIGLRQAIAANFIVAALDGDTLASGQPAAAADDEQ